MFCQNMEQWRSASLSSEVQHTIYCATGVRKKQLEHITDIRGCMHLVCILYICEYDSTLKVLENSNELQFHTS